MQDAWEPPPTTRPSRFNRDRLDIAFQEKGDLAGGLGRATPVLLGLILGGALGAAMWFAMGWFGHSFR
jgi:hypothetical protein